jgi:large subunit ribosomal protein L23
MALFGKKENTETPVTTAVEAKAVSNAPTTLHERKQSVLLIPRLSEKAYKVAAQNKYIFKVSANQNKIEIRKAVEQQFGVKVASINMVSMKGKYRSYGRILGRMSDFKKAIVTLTPDSKKIDTVEISK